MVRPAMARPGVGRQARDDVRARVRPAPVDCYESRSPALLADSGRRDRVEMELHQAWSSPFGSSTRLIRGSGLAISRCARIGGWVMGWNTTAERVTSFCYHAPTSCRPLSDG